MDSEVNNDNDFSLPMATLLRIGTSKAHDEVNSLGGIRLLRGELDKEEYVCFLMILWYIYE